MDDEDITDKIADDSYKLNPVYEDIIITVTAKGYIEPSTVEPTSSEPTTNPQFGKGDNSSTGGNNQNNQSSNPLQTGETTNIVFWIVLMILSAVIVILSRQHSKKEKTINSHKNLPCKNILLAG